ncbi:MAG: hypothetical protein JWN33_153 [Candidatus Saccharibacteria bacterium]|nr:hypothetical protein [Candidatus Saccharibacteria bacterium]
MKHMNISLLGKSVGSFLARYQQIIFFILIAGVAALSILTLNQIILKSHEANGYTSSLSGATVDQGTVNRINHLKATNGQGSSSIPAGSINPFGNQ